MSDVSQLTPKQRQVYTLTAEGKGVSEIAKRMKITQSGVYGHLRKMRALGIDPTAEAAGVVDPPAAPAVETSRAASNGHVPSAEEFLAGAIDEIEAAQAEVEQYIEQHRSEIAHAEKEAETLGERITRLHAAREALAA